ncbi:MAG: Crp/Fnr family transcriptional regulator [Lewinella sp.]|nr:Crp/Fnr family transcriptional regulator [Lewinella sp.]
MDRLHEALSFGGILPRESVDHILSHVEDVRLVPQEYFLLPGAISNRLGFVNEGILRSYALGPDGEEVTKYFIRPKQFAVDLESYYNNHPSEAALQAVVPTQVFTIGRNAWNRLSEEIPKMYILMKSLTEATLLNKIKDNDFLNFGTASDKYREFLRRYPDLAREVPLQYIASYLKITPQSLSRIRKQLAGKE